MDLWSDDEGRHSPEDNTGLLSIKSPLLTPRTHFVDTVDSPRNAARVSRLSPSWEAVKESTDSSASLLDGDCDREGDNREWDSEHELGIDGQGKEMEDGALLPPADGLYAWLLCFLAFWVHFSAFGFLMAFGVFIQPIAEEFDVGSGTVSWAISISMGTMLSIGFVTGTLADRLGPRWVIFSGGLLTSGAVVVGSFTTAAWQMMLFYSVPFGVGLSMSALPLLSLLSQWFIKWRGLATGLAVAGTGMGTVFFPLIAEALLERHGWRWTFRIFAEAMALIVLISALLVRRRTPVKTHRTSLDLAKYLKQPFLWIMMAAVFCTSLCYMIPYSHVITYAEVQGVDSLDAALIVSTMGLASTAGRVIMGVVADKLGRLRVLRLASLVLAVDTYLWFFCTNLETLLVFGAIYGFVSGALITVLGPLCAEFFGLENLTAMMGIVFSGAGLGMLLGPPIAGYVYDITESFTLAILFGGTAMLIGFIFFVVLKKPADDHTATEVLRISYGSIRVDSGSQTYIPSGDAVWKTEKVLSPRTSLADSSFAYEDDLTDDTGVP